MSKLKNYPLKPQKKPKKTITQEGVLYCNNIENNKCSDTLNRQIQIFKNFESCKMIPEPLIIKKTKFYNNVENNKC